MYMYLNSGENEQSAPVATQSALIVTQSALIVTQSVLIVTQSALIVTQSVLIVTQSTPIVTQSTQTLHCMRLRNGTEEKADETKSKAGSELFIECILQVSVCDTCV